MEQLQAALGPASTAVLSAMSMFGEQLLLIVILGFLYWGWNKRLGKAVGLGVLMGVVWNPMLKNIVLRRRPYFDHKGISILRPVEPKADLYDIAAQGYSFPSGHSTNAVTVYGGIALRERKSWLTAAAVVLPLLVGISRVAVGAHYPTDVLFGWLLGAVVVAVVDFLQKKIQNPALLGAVCLLCVLPGLFYCRSEDYFTGLGLLAGFIFGTLFEEKFVHFEDTRKPAVLALRIIGGAAVYFGLNSLLKLPFPKEFLEGPGLTPLLVRAARYAVVAFVDFGVYPMLFRLEKKMKAA